MGHSISKSAAGRGSNRTTSPIISETKTGSLTMHIAGYSQTKGIAVGESIKSSTFDAGEHSWSVAYYPNGAYQETVGWTSVYLHLDRPRVAGDVVTAAFQFSLLAGDGPDQRVFAITGSDEWIFSLVDGYSRYRGFSKLIKRKHLKSCVGREAFRIRCEVTVLRTLSASLSTVEVPIPTTSELHRHLGDVLATGDGYDVCFMVAGEPVLANRIVLAAQSSVLKDELFGPGKDTAATCVEVDNMDASVFRAMLQFVYTDTLPDIEEGNRAAMAQGLLVAADRFNIGRLKLICADMLCRGINGETVASILMLAEKYGCQGLQRACLMFIKTAPLRLLQRGRRE